MKKIFLSFLFLIAVSFFTGVCYSQTTLTALTANNTAACPASGPLPAQCQTAFVGQADPRSGVATALFDRPPGNVSVEDMHAYLTHGTGTKIYANFMLGYCLLSGQQYCHGNVQTGYVSNDSNTAAAQAEDLIRRHVDGAIMTWEGDGTTEDAAALKFQSYVNAHHCSGPQSCTPMYLIMIDGPSYAYNVTSTGVANTSGTGCATTLTATNFENCVIAHIKNDMCYMNGTHWGNNAYQKSSGRPIVQVFPSESGTPITATGPAPSWADVWNDIGQWNSDLTTNCTIQGASTQPYAGDNGQPLLVFEDASGFTHEATSGSFYWVQPAGTDPASDQFVYNISPASTGGTLDNFYQIAQQYPSDLVWGAAFKGFNSSLAGWGQNRIMDQDCGQTWTASLTAGNSYYASAGLPYLQVATWNDYNEGTEIESGIDNCYAVAASISGQTLSWTLQPTNAQLASLSTVSHVEIYDSSDGENVTLVGSSPAAANGTFSLSSLQTGQHTLFVRMIGKNSILNRISSGVTYSATQ